MGNNKVIIPDKIKKGDTIGLLSVSGNVQDFEAFENAVKYFETQGFKIKVSENTYTSKNYLAGSDEDRAKAFNDFFKDPEIKAVIAIRGGYGAIRILDKIDWEIVKNNPKIFVGYSDVTALSLMVYKKAKLITYSGPMAYSDFSQEVSDYTANSLFKALTKELTEIKIDNPKVYNSGIGEGILWGGNLATVQSLCGLDFIPDEKFVFIVEDINEPVYKIDKMFTQLLNIEKFKQNLNGIVLGDFSGVDNQNWFDDFIFEIAKKLDIPVIGGIKFGHEKEKQTVPIGVKVFFDSDSSVLKIFSL